MAYERIIITGNLGGEPDIRMAGEQKVANFNIAVNRKRGDQQQTLWIRCAAWNGRAELAEKYLKKGSRVLIEGSGLRVNAYLDKNGKPQASLEMNVDQLQFLDNKPADDGGNADSEDPDAIPF
ncbi:MAG: single-stranded DNA-binding protein [Anaerolineae bacterium]|nr:single-stranded DNA-binding protein [Anaerolineae bacterium]